MRKRLIIIVVVACALSLCCVWFSCEKKIEIEHNECAEILVIVIHIQRKNKLKKF